VSSLRGRGELAAQMVGDSHGLDDGSLVGTMVLRAIAAQIGVSNPLTAEARRALWEAAGVLCDEVSTTVLCKGLFPPRSEARAPSLLSARSAAGWESHLSLKDLRRFEHFVASGTEVFVCENPRVLEAAMDAGSRVAMVCAGGNPTLVTTKLLERLAADGARIRYRGDFDWPGVSIANRVIERFGASPWRMGAGDYEAALAAAGRGVVDLPRLDGHAVQAVWDGELAGAMESSGRVVHEERMLELLIGDVT
ncbi:MAG: TIGR02679 family protein, partial [Acidimicrobiales bacterium]